MEFAGGGVEALGVAGKGAEVGVAADDEGGSGAVDVDELLVAQGFHELDNAGDAVPGGGVVGEVFGADAEFDGGPGSDSSGDEFGGEGEGEAFSLEEGLGVPALECAGEEVHGWGADEAGDEAGGGAVVDFEG